MTKYKAVFITVICMICGSSYAQKGVLSQHFSLEATDKTIKEVLKKLETLGNCSFGYSENTIDVKKTVSLNASDQSLRQILRIIFPNKTYQFKKIGDKILIYSQNILREAIGNRYTINGYLREKGSKEYLSNVSITIPELKTGTVSNDYGFYSLTLPEGAHEFWISYLGYATQVEEVVLSYDIQRNFMMEVQSEALEEVIIDGDRETAESETTQMSAVRLESAEVASIPTILGEKDVLRSLQLLPGVSSGFEGSTGFYVRGGSPDQNLILLDEAPVYNSNHLFGLFSVFNGDAIKTTEIFKGGFPARFGGRLSSVLKIDTKNGNKERIQGKYTIGLITSSFLLEGPLSENKTSFVLTGRRTYIDALVRPFLKKDKGGTGGYLYSDINFKIHHIFTDKDKIFWSNYFGEDKFFFKLQEDFDFNSRLKVRWGNITSTLRWNHEFSSTLFSNTSLIFSNYKFGVGVEVKDVEDISIPNPTSSEYNLSSGINDYGIKMDLNYYPDPNHSIRMGMFSTYHDFVPGQSRLLESGGPLSSQKQQIVSVESAIYLEDDWEVSEEFSINGGIRASHFVQGSKQYIKPEPRFSLSWKPRHDLAIKGSYAEMNQYIHLLTFSGIGLPTDLWVSSTDKVKPQFSRQIAVGLAKDFFEKDYTLTLEGYYKKMNNIISYKEGSSFLDIDEFSDRIDPSLDLKWEDKITAGQGWAYGAEFLLRKKTGKFTGWLGYTLSWSQRQFDELNLGRKFNAKYDRRHDLSIVGIYKPSKKITLSGTWVISSGINFSLPDRITQIRAQNIFTSTNISQPQLATFLKERNNFKGETYHRLDLGIQFHKRKRKNRERTWAFSVFNTYNQRNALFYFGDEKGLRKISALQLIPSLSYSCKF